MLDKLTAQRTYQMLDNESLWGVAQRVNKLLAREHIDHAIVGGVAVCLHGYRRNTVDLDLLVREEDARALRSVLESEGFRWDVANKEYRSASGVTVQLVLAGESEGPGQPAK